MNIEPTERKSACTGKVQMISPTEEKAIVSIRIKKTNRSLLVEVPRSALVQKGLQNGSEFSARTPAKVGEDLIIKKLLPPKKLSQKKVQEIRSRNANIFHV